MKQVLMRGPVLTQSGYGVHSRQVAQWLLKKNDINVKFIATPWGDTPWIVDPSAYGGLIKEIMTRTTKPELAGPVDVSFQLQLPNEWGPLAKKNIGITAAVETDRCHPGWVGACNMMDMVIVPSEHAKTSLTNTGTVTKPLIVIPESFSDGCMKPSDTLPVLPNFSTPFNFLVFGQITGTNVNNDRKNIFNTLKWLCEAFANDKDVGIIVKTNAGRNTKIDRNVCTVLLKQLVSEVKKGPYPKIHLLHGDMSDDEVAALYKHPQVKALVALTRGEGFGLPILEAAASGLPIIATGWSGHTDFLKHGRYISVYYQLNEIHPTRIDDKIFMKGARWATPSEEDFKHRVIKFRHSSNVPKEWAADLKNKIQDTYSFDKICEYYDEATKDIWT